MSRLAILAVVLALVPGSVYGADLTCKAFETRFKANLKQMARDAPALTISDGQKTETNPHMAYRISSNGFLTGNVECFNADQIREFDLAVDLKDVNTGDSARRVAMLRKVASASVCAMGGFTTARCETATLELFSKVHRQLQLAADHKDPLPADDEYLGVGGDTELNLSARTGEMQFTIFINSAASTQ